MSARSLTAIYSYDGMGNRDVQTAPGNNPTEMYYDARGQLISQGIYIPGKLAVETDYVWSAGNGYQNALVLRDDNYGIYNTQYMNFNDREYAQYDAVYSITSLTGYQAIPGDGNADGVVDNADFVLISNHFGLTIPGGAAVGDFNGDGTVDGSDLAIFDANTGHTGTGTWVIADRFDYTPYGVMTTLSASNFTSSADIYAWNIGFQGMVYDTGTKLNFTLRRVYEAETGRFLTVDPAHADGMDWYRGFADNPISHTDPTGLSGYGSNYDPSIDGILYHPPEEPDLSILEDKSGKGRCDVSGPDITSNLAAMIWDVKRKWNALGYFDKEELMLETITPTFAIGAWDIDNLPEESVDSGGPAGNGTGDGKGTVAVDGKVYQQRTVNYWLAGLIFNAISTANPNTAGIFSDEVILYTSFKLEMPDQKQSWFFAGIAGDLSAVPEPKAFSKVKASTLPPARKLTWHWESLSGTD